MIHQNQFIGKPVPNINIFSLHFKLVAYKEELLFKTHQEKMKPRETTEIHIYAAMKREEKMESTNSYIDIQSCALIYSVQNSLMMTTF